jgi:putative tryptophan/tyrosine transport system substrate-binding protein
LVEQKAGALLIGGSSTLDSARDQIILLAARYSIPTMFTYPTSIRAGGLMSYTAGTTETMRLAGVYAGRILKGEKAADLPIQQATKFEFVINLKTARALKLTIPPALLALADEVIE